MRFTRAKPLPASMARRLPVKNIQISAFSFVQNNSLKAITTWASASSASFLERRLDMVVYRANFAPSIFAARQLVSHSHVTVNGKKANIASYSVNDNDVIEVKTKSKQMPLILEAVQKAERDVPGYMAVDGDKLSAKYTRQPVYADIPYPVQMEPHLIIEFYSR